MPLDWSFLLDRGVNFRTKRCLLDAGFSAALQLEEVGLTGLAKDPEIFAEAQQRGLILITKDTDFLKDIRYARGCAGILYIMQSRTELQDTIAASLSQARHYPSLADMRFTIKIGGQCTRHS